MWWNSTETKERGNRSASPIPLELPGVAGWKEVPIKEKGEPLVALGPFSDHREIETDAIYFGQRVNSPYMVNELNGEEPLTGSLLTMFVRESVAKQLMEAQRLLPKGMYLAVWEPYRTLEVQQSLFDTYYNALKAQHPDWSEDALLTETQRYVSLPSTVPARPSPHNTGGSVDVSIFKLPPKIDQQVSDINTRLTKLTDGDWEIAYKMEMEKIDLINQYSQLLEFGAPLDHGGEKAGLNYYERLATLRELTPEEIAARDNRRLLYNIMKEVGFEPYEDEFWHYNSKKSQMGAKSAGLPYAEFGAAKLSPKNLEHEKMRREHRLGTLRLKSGEWGANLTLQAISPEYAKQFEAAQKAAIGHPDIRDSKWPMAEIIKPPEEKK